MAGHLGTLSNRFALMVTFEMSCYHNLQRNVFYKIIN